MSKLSIGIHHFRHRNARLLHRPHIPYGPILMLHRVDTPDEKGVWYNEHLKMSPNVIEEMTEYARKRGREFVSIDGITRKRMICKVGESIYKNKV